MERRDLWQVTAHATEDLFDEGNAPDNTDCDGVETWVVFSAYFSNHAQARKQYDYGKKHFPKLFWSLSPYVMDDPALVEMQFDDLHQRIGG